MPSDVAWHDLASPFLRRFVPQLNSYARKRFTQVCKDILRLFLPFNRRTLLEAKVIYPEIAGLDAEGTEVELHRQYR